MEPRDPVILLIDPANTRNGSEYETAIRDLGFRVVSLSTGLLPADATPPLDPDGETSLYADDVDDAVRQVRAAGFDLRAVVPANGSSLHVADQIAARLGLPGNDPALGWARRNKAAMRVRAAQTGSAYRSSGWSTPSVRWRRPLRTSAFPSS